MISNTLIITGAGSSIPYGMPTTSDLTSEIIGHSKKLLGVYDLKGKEGDDLNRHLIALLQSFKRSGSESIDQFLMNPELAKQYGLNAKRCLAYRLLLRQKSAVAALFPGADNPSGDWLRYLFGRMGDGCISSQGFIGNNSVSFVTFNYDVLIEAYQTSVLKHRWEYESERLPFPVHHIYGKISDNYDIDYLNSLTLDGALVDSAAEMINVISENERTDKSQELSELFSDSEIVLVTGFGWMPENMKQLPWHRLPHTATVYCGFYGTPKPVIKRAIKYIKKMRRLEDYDIMKIKEVDSHALGMVMNEVDLLKPIKR